MFASFDQAVAMGSRGADKDRDLFLENCLHATAPAGHDAGDEQLDVFGYCLKRYLKQWLAEHEQAVAKAKQSRTRPPGYEELATRLWRWTRVRVPTDGPAAGMPRMLTRLVSDPVRAIRESAVTDLTERTVDCWRVPAEAFTGGRLFRRYNWKCTPKDGAVVYGSMTDKSRMVAALTVDEEIPEAQQTLQVEGQDSDKLWCPPVWIRILVNGRTVFEGPSPFAKRAWSTLTITVPAGILHKGENTVEFRCETNSDSLTSHWCMISEVRLRHAP
jgi:hypothetical protein